MMLFSENHLLIKIKPYILDNANGIDAITAKQSGAAIARL